LDLSRLIRVGKPKQEQDLKLPILLLIGTLNALSVLKDVKVVCGWNA